MHQIAIKQGIPESTIYAVLRGRLPNRDTLAAIVTEWAGPDVIPTWLAKRSEVEAELETDRRKALARLGLPATTPPSGRPARSIRGDAAASNEAVQQFAEELRALRRSAGDPSLRAISQATGGGGYRGGLAHTTLSYMLRGLRFQDWTDVRKVVQALNGNADEWKQKWLVAARTTNLTPGYIERVERDLLP